MPDIIDATVSSPDFLPMSVRGSDISQPPTCSAGWQVLAHGPHVSRDQID